MNIKYFSVFMLVPFALIITIQLLNSKCEVKDYEHKQNLTFATEYKLNDEHYVYKKHGVIIGETFIYKQNTDINKIFFQFGAIKEGIEETSIGKFYNGRSAKMKKYKISGCNMQVYEGKNKIVVGFPYIYGSY
ncbi:MAG: hypothetical protein RR334_00130 [Clostridia bacterium]